MNPLKTKTAIIIVILLVVVGFASVGCRQKIKKYEVINTTTLPGHTFSYDEKPSNSKVVYLGNQKSDYSSNFGPNDVSFDFEELRR